MPAHAPVAACKSLRRCYVFTLFNKNQMILMRKMYAFFIALGFLALQVIPAGAQSPVRTGRNAGLNYMQTLASRSFSVARAGISRTTSTSYFSGFLYSQDIYADYGGNGFTDVILYGDPAEEPQPVSVSFSGVPAGVFVSHNISYTDQLGSISFYFMNNMVSDATVTIHLSTSTESLDLTATLHAPINFSAFISPYSLYITAGQFPQQATLYTQSITGGAVSLYITPDYIPFGISMDEFPGIIPAGASVPLTFYADPYTTPGQYYVRFRVMNTTFGSNGPINTERYADLSIFVEAPPAVIAYNDGPYCNSGFAPVTITNPSQNGQFTGDYGVDVDQATGTVNLANSTPGFHMVYYTVFYPGYNSTAASIEIGGVNMPHLLSQSVCSGAVVPVSNFGVDNVYSWQNSNSSIGLTTSGNGDVPAFVANNTTNIEQVATITVTGYSSGGCAPATSSYEIHVAPELTASIHYPSNSYCNTTGFVPVTTTGQLGGSYYSEAGLSIDNNTGSVNPALSVPGTYTVKYKINGACGTYITSTTMRINSKSVAPVVLSSSAAAPVCSGTNVLLTQTGGSTGTQAIWQWYTDPGFTIAVGPATLAPNAQITVAPTQTTSYYLKAIGGICDASNQPARTESVQPQAFVKVVVLQLTASISATNTQLCGGGSTSINIIGGPSNGTVTVTKTGGLTQSVLLNNLGAATFTTGSLTQNTTYTITTISTPSCAVTVSIPVTIFVSQLSPAAIPNQVVCSGTPTAPISFQSGFAPGTLFQWTNSNPAIGLVGSGISTQLPSFVPVSNNLVIQDATIAVTPVAAIGGCSVGSVSFRIRVYAAPTVDAVSNQSLCAGAFTSQVSFSGNMLGTTYSWSNNNTSTGLAAAGTGNIPATAVVNNTGSTQTSTVVVTPRNSTCSGAATNFMVTVNPSVARISYPQAAYCQAGWAYAVLNGSTGGIYTGSPAGLQISSSTGAINLALSVPGIYTVTYNTVSQGACSGTASTQITVRPQATVNPVTNQVVCGGTVTSPVVFTGTAASYLWTNDNPSIGLASAGTGNLPSFAALNAGPGAVYGTIRVTPVGNGSTSCTAKAISFRYLVNFCPPVTHAGDHSGDGNTGRISIQVSASPNPTQGRVTVELSNKEAGSYSIQVLNSFGEPVNKAMFFSGNSISVDLSGLNPGVYRLQVLNTRTGSSVQKQVIKL
jgi:hypothetical protein